MHLPSVEQLKVTGRKVLLRTNYDVPLTLNGQVANDQRIKVSLPTIKYLLREKASVVIISHLDRPGGKPVAKLSLKPVAMRLGKLLGQRVWLADGSEQKERVTMLENLRFNPGEEANEEEFAKRLAERADFYVNDAFACSHRRHASIVGVPEFLPSAFGFDFLQEIEFLSEVRIKPRRPLVLILGGTKKDKIQLGRRLVGWVDWLLVGGNLVTYEGARFLLDQPKVIGSLIRAGEDITMETEARFKKIIAQAGTIFWVGPLGWFERSKYERGTREIAEAVVKSGALSIVGGGDTETALRKFGLEGKIDFISSGGGAMLNFLADGTLPGIEAVKRCLKIQNLDK